MGASFVRDFQARWADMDFNQHMANTEFLNYAEQTRMLFLESRGWGMTRFADLQLGPVVLEDRLTYKREIRMLESFTVDLCLAAATDDVRRMRVVNRFHTPAGDLCATVASVVLWFDPRERRPVAPPEDLAGAWLELERTEDFERW